ncbi:MAG: Uncharacterised protein [Cellulomonadaceae bacterium TMED98]|nr:MAG: Uncharacterised protein [Cellulomonadaceae bacterium TMED98]
MAYDIGQVLVEGSAEVNIQHLGPSANTQDGKVHLEGRSEEGVFASIAQLFKALVFRGWFVAVAAGVDIGTAGQQQTIQASHDVSSLFGGERLRGQEHSRSPGTGDRVQILRRQRR